MQRPMSAAIEISPLPTYENSGRVSIIGVQCMLNVHTLYVA